MNRIFRSACVAVLPIFLLAVSCVSCQAGGKKAARQPEVPSLEYAGKLCNLESARNIEVTGDGLILAHSSEAECASPIYVYTVDGTYEGTLKSNGTDILADAIFVDGADRVCALDRSAGTVRRFTTDGTPVDTVPLGTLARDIPVTDEGLALRGDGTLLVASTGLRGNLSLALLDQNLSVSRALAEEDIALMLETPVGTGAADQAVIQAVAAGHSGETLLVIAFGEGPYDARDGILELDAALAFVRYVGDKGQFNASEDACVDDAGIRYVADTWNRRLCAFDADWNLVAVSARDRRGKPLVVNPHCVRVKGDDVYVVAYGKERTFEAAALHRFKVFRPKA